MKKIAVIFCSFIVLHSYAQTKSWADTAATIENILSRYKPENPGIQVSISRNGVLLFSKAWGMADMEHNIPLTTESVTEAGSVSKQFTAAAILLLEQEGKLSLDDDVRKYVPEIPDYGRPISLRRMIQHKSGIKDWGSIAAIAGWPRSTKTYNNDDALYIISRQKTLNNQPGDEFIYSNSNYNLLAIIVQRVSGMSLYDYTLKKIFEPAGMKHTQWRSDFKKIVPNRAIAYAKNGEGYFTNMPNEYVYGNGGLLTTTEDLVLWNNYYGNGKLGTPSLLQKQITGSKFTNGVSNGYASGLFIDQYHGMELWTHNGATASYRSNLDYFPILGLSIAWLSNTSEYDGSQLNLTNALRDLFIAKPANETATKQPIALAVTADKLKTYTGWYKNSKNAAGLNLQLLDGIIKTNSGQALIPTADKVFMLGNNRIEFIEGNQRLYAINAAKDTTLYIRTDSASLNAAAMQEYVGTYSSEEADVKFMIQVKNDKLVMIQQPSNEYELTPGYKDGFESPIASVWFERDKNKKIIRMRLYVSRARNIQFDKVK